jgi:ketosteroid isomerase-like protein
MLQTKSTLTWRVALAAIGAVLIVSTLVTPLQAAEPSGEGAKVAAAVEALRVAMVAGNEKELNALVDDHLTYGHSHGMLQDKAAFVKYLVGPNAPGKFKWIKISNQTIDVVGNVALVRHNFDGENILPDGKITKAHILLLQVWKKQKGNWKLLARQACPLD